MTPLFAFLTASTMILLGIVGVLIFGRRLPELARELEKSMAELQQNMGDLGFVLLMMTAAAAFALAWVLSRSLP